MNANPVGNFLVVSQLGSDPKICKREIVFMQRKIVFGTLAAGMIALAPAVKAQTNIVTCNPATASTIAYLGDSCEGAADAASPTGCDADGVAGGLPVAAPAVTKIELEANMSGCTSNAAKITAWDLVGEEASKVTGIKLGAGAGLIAIDNVDIKIKAISFGTCNFSVPAANAYSAHGKGSLKWFNAGGDGVGKSTFYGHVAGDIGTYSATDDGIVTKGFGIGSEIHASVGFDLAAVGNTPILGCNTGAPPASGFAPVIFFTHPGLGTTTLSLDFP